MLKGRGRCSWRQALTVGIMSLAAVVVLPCSPVGAAETQRLGIKPAFEANYFNLSMLPGGETTNTAVVTNFSDETLRVRIYAVDAEITPQGQFSLAAEQAPRNAIGKWISLSVSELSLAPQSNTEVDFAMAVPPGADVQDYAGGIVIEGEPREQAPLNVGPETAVQLNVVERLGVRVYLKVEGTRREHLVAGSLRWDRVSGGAIEFSLDLRNDGNVSLAPTGTVTLHGFGLSGRSIILSRPELLPGWATTVRGRWESPALYTRGHANADISYGNGQTANASTDIRLIPLIRTALVALLAVLVFYLTYRLIRFVRKARHALRTLKTLA